MVSKLRQQVLNAKDVNSELVDVPHWGVKIEVRGMTVGERVRFFDRVYKNVEVDRTRYMPELLISTCFDPDSGEQVFEPADRDMLNTKSAAAVQLLVDAANRLSGFAGGEETDLDETPIEGLS